MPAARAVVRFQEILAAATDIFIARGYRRTKMEDVTRRLGLSAGAVYRYVESKDALFDAALRAGLAPGVDPELLSFPLPTPAAGSTLSFLASAADVRVRLPRLFEAAERAEAVDVSAECQAVLAELYDELAANRVALRLIESSAVDWPEMAELWFGSQRLQAVTALMRYLERRLATGALAPVPSVAALARFIITALTYFAVDRHFDPQPTPMSEEDSRTSALLLVSRALGLRPGVANG